MIGKIQSFATRKQRRDFRSMPGREIDLAQGQKKEVRCWPNLSMGKYHKRAVKAS